MATRARREARRDPGNEPAVGVGAEGPAKSVGDLTEAGAGDSARERPPTQPPRFRPPTPEPMRGVPDLFTFLRAARDNPLATWTQEHFRAPVVMGKGVLGRVMVLSDPEGIRHVLVDNAANYRKDALTRRVLGSGIGDGLFTAEGQIWRQLRRTLAPLFSARRVDPFGADMAGAAETVARRLARREGRTVDVAVEATRLTLDVLERTIFTTGLQRDPDALGRAITLFFEGIGPIDPLDVFGLPDALPRIGRLRARPAIAFFEAVVDELVRDRRALLARHGAAEGAAFAGAGAPGLGGAVPSDLLTLLLAARDPETGEALDDASVRANIATFIAAGHETTANALTWSLYLIAQDEAVRARLEAEVDAVAGDAPLSPEHLPALPYTRAVVEEAMRLYPPAPFMSREAIAEDRVLGFRLRPGTIVMIAPYIVHRHALLWEDPAAFDPERFLPPRREAIDRYAYLPFGAGPRVCIGARFALHEAMIALAAIVRRVRLDLVPGHLVEPVQRVTLRPRNGMKMRVHLRRPLGG